MSTPSRELLDLSPKLIFDLASKVNPPHIVAAEHGLDPTWLIEFMETPHVKRAVKEKERELAEAGYSLVAKSKLMLEDVLPDIYRRMKDPGTSLSSLLDGAKFLRQMSGLDKQDVNPQKADKFSITINIGGITQPPVTVDVQAVEVVSEADEFPAIPSWVQNFSPSTDLMTDAIMES